MTESVSLRQVGQYNLADWNRQWKLYAWALSLLLIYKHILIIYQKLFIQALKLLLWNSKMVCSSELFQKPTPENCELFLEARNHYNSIQYQFKQTLKKNIPNSKYSLSLDKNSFLNIFLSYVNNDGIFSCSKSFSLPTHPQFISRSFTSSEVKFRVKQTQRILQKQDAEKL